MRPNIAFGNNELLSPGGLNLLEEAEQHTEETIAEAEVRLEGAMPLEEFEAAIIDQVVEAVPFEANTANIEEERRRKLIIVKMKKRQRQRMRPLLPLGVQYPRRHY